jgi:hypothetical protein
MPREEAKSSSLVPALPFAGFPRGTPSSLGKPMSLVNNRSGKLIKGASHPDTRLRPRAARQDAVTRMSCDGVAERALALLTRSA